MARGAWPDPRHDKHFFTPQKIFSKLFLIGCIPYVSSCENFGKFFWGVSGTGPVEPQGHDQCLWHVCTLYITAYMSTCTAATCQFCPAMSEGEWKHSYFEIKECNIVRTHSCDSKEAKMTSRSAFLDSKQQNPVFKYH